jgi:putative transposase
MTTEIARSYRLIGIEDLNLKGMLKNRRLALSLSDAAMGEICRQLVYKSAWFGGQVVKVDRFFASSKTCSECGHVNHDLQLSDRRWTCQGCGTIHDRDWNASKNIEVEALRLVGA